MNHFKKQKSKRRRFLVDLSILIFIYLFSTRHTILCLENNQTDFRGKLENHLRIFSFKTCRKLKITKISFNLKQEFDCYRKKIRYQKIIFENFRTKIRT